MKSRYDSPAGLDLYGNPRFLDGDLDSVMRVDMGAHEFSNVQLAITGSATPGGSLTFDTTGTTGLPFVRCFGIAAGETLVPPIGPLFFDLTSYWTVDPSAGMIPARMIVPLPTGMFASLPLIFQDIAIDPARAAGNTSNPVEVVIE